MNVSDNKLVVLVCGPTASGKTATAISLARYFKTEIISADSRQCYKELKVGVARPTEQQLTQVPHHFIASYSVREIVNAAVFEQFALRKSEELFQSHQVVVMAGGTGLYIKAFCEGLDEIPDVPDLIRKTIVEEYAQRGIAWLQEQIKLKDPLYFETGEVQNPHRLLRALEVWEATGRSVLSFRTKKKAERNFSIIKIGLSLPREELCQAIDQRVIAMIREGLPDEVRGLLPFRSVKALQTVGYKELFAWVDGSITLDDAISEIRKNTKQYAKRQLTWFKKDKDIEWFSPYEQDKILNFASRKI